MLFKRNGKLITASTKAKAIHKVIASNVEQIRKPIISAMKAFGLGSKDVELKPAITKYNSIRALFYNDKTILKYDEKRFLDGCNNFGEHFDKKKDMFYDVDSSINNDGNTFTINLFFTFLCKGFNRPKSFRYESIGKTLDDACDKLYKMIKKDVIEVEPIDTPIGFKNKNTYHK